MEAFFHSVKLDESLCVGCTNCVKRCPTGAIRVRDGKAHIIRELCTDCGECIRICPHHAKSVVIDPVSVVGNFKYAIALPAPSLYGQFNNLTSVEPVLGALRAMGFAEVYEVARAAEIVSDLTHRMMAAGELKLPVISCACPVAVRLIRTRFPSLINNILPILPPVEVAARLAKQEFCAAHGCDPGEVGTVFISPCAAKATACRDALGFDKSEVDAVVAMRDIYPLLLRHMKQPDLPPSSPTAGQMGIGWGSSGGESGALGREDNYLAADGIENIIRVLENLEDEKIRDVEFVELNACSGGCVEGILTVENPYVARVKLARLKNSRPASCTDSEGLPRRPLLFDHPIKFCQVLKLDDDREVALEKMARIAEVESRLYGMDCGACGAPNCHAMATDIVMGKATEDMCIYKVREELSQHAHTTSSERWIDMTVAQLQQALHLYLLTPQTDGAKQIDSVFCCDLLSLAMGRAPAGCAWVTVMGNLNTIAVATLADVGCIVLAEGVTIGPDCIARAVENNIPVFTTAKGIFETAKAIDALL